MKRLAIVVQRCHADIVGGSEALAWHYAQLLRTRYAVDVLTSCALDYRSWDNALPAGVEQRDGVAVHRFASAWPRGGWFDALHRRLLRDRAQEVARGDAGALSWRAALAEQFVRAQGPWCPQLFAHLQAQAAGYAAVLFCTYLYPTTYFGLACVPADKCVLVPTLHDEPPAYLQVYAQAARRVPRLIWLTEAERRLGARLWRTDRGSVVGMAVNMEPAQAVPSPRPYLLYCGRIDESKGCRELLQAFRTLRRRRADAELVLTGVDHLGLRDGDGLRYLGFVDEARKRALMAGAAAFVMPSRWESFSIVTLEALAQGTPVIVNGRCEVLADHVALSGAGWISRDDGELALQMTQALDLAAEQRAAMGERGRRYVEAHYGEAVVVQRLLRVVEHEESV